MGPMVGDRTWCLLSIYLPDSVWLILNNQEKNISSASLKSTPLTRMKTAAGGRPAVPTTDDSNDSVRSVDRRQPVTHGRRSSAPGLCHPTRSPAARLWLSTDVVRRAHRHPPPVVRWSNHTAVSRRRRWLAGGSTPKHARNTLKTLGKTKEPPRRGGSSTSSDFGGLSQSVESASRTALALDTRASLLHAVEIPAMETAMGGLVDEASLPTRSTRRPCRSGSRPLSPDGVPSCFTSSSIAARFAEGRSFDFGRMMGADRAVHLHIR